MIHSASSQSRPAVILKFWDGRTLCVKIVITVVGLVYQQDQGHQ